MNSTAADAERKFDRDYDYIVVGAGTAGCVLAARLSERADNRVCLIEAGGSEQHPYIRIPAAVGAAIMSPKFGWGLWTVPQAALGGRKVPLPRGRVIGGSGSINGMAYYRGPAADFDDWAAAGNPGWSYADLLPYFLRSEHNPEFSDSPYHAIGGPMGVSFPKSRNRLCDAFNASMASLGYDELEDFNVPEPNGYGYRQGTIFNGRRVSTASAYLRPAMNRSNLEVLSEALARRVLIEGGRAVGVEIERGGKRERLGAGAEVVVACGSYHSPHLLQLSGIGDGQSLRNAGVTPVHELPAVGRHLKDQPSMPVTMDMRDSTSYGLSLKALPRDIAQIFQYLLFRSGPLSSNLFETNAYIRTSPETDRPDMQLVFQPARRNIKPFPIPIGHGFAIAPVCLYPKSEGTVTIASPDPHDAPSIDLALGSDERDLEFLLGGLKLARRVIAHQAFAPYDAKERDPGPSVTADNELLDYIKRTLVTVHHPASSCRMGPAGDNVVDAELKVHGLDKLRVVDASVFPHLVGANTNASVVAVAEKGADLILGIEPPPPIDWRRARTNGGP
ncbi:MAG: GMC family oxidoreductase N-terminal domain-containing protein, partial [Gammaproteobacteria bacterium]|nr:GMC family oxidoreductase N-terminal domain-containing protein [Gammaproteobacteria bacterium]